MLGRRAAAPFRNFKTQNVTATSPLKSLCENQAQNDCPNPSTQNGAPGPSRPLASCWLPPEPRYSAHAVPLHPSVRETAAGGGHAPLGQTGLSRCDRENPASPAWAHGCRGRAAQRGLGWGSRGASGGRFRTHPSRPHWQHPNSCGGGSRPAEVTGLPVLGADSWPDHAATTRTCRHGGLGRTALLRPSR